MHKFQKNTAQKLQSINYETKSKWKKRKLHVIKFAGYKISKLNTDIDTIFE